MGLGEAYVDMGWEDIKVAVEYDGDQHRSNRRQYVKDIRRAKLERADCNAAAKSAAFFTVALRSARRQVGSRRLISNAAKPASASTSAPSRSQPALASPLMVS